MRRVVRGIRSDLAGLGTYGSLVAGAALLFLVASAIVAFRGWPQVINGPATTVVASAAGPLAHSAAPSRTARRLAVVLRRRSATAGRAAVRGTTVTRRRASGSRGAAPTAPGPSRPASPSGAT